MARSLIKMTSPLIIQVIIFCTIFSFPSTNSMENKTNTDNDLNQIPGLDVLLDITIDDIIDDPSAKSVKYEVMSHDELGKIPGLKILKHITIRKDNKDTSLSKMFGKDPKEWIGDFQVVADTSFTAMCCLFSERITSSIRKAEKDVDICGKTDTCFNIKLQLRQLKFHIVKMLTIAMNYIKTFKIRPDTNALNAIMSFYLFLKSIKWVDGSPYDGSNDPADVVENFIKKFLRTKLYTRYLIETFATLNCSWSAFEDDKSNKIDGYDYKFLNEFNFPQTYFEDVHFDLQILLLANVPGIRLSPVTDSSKVGYVIEKPDDSWSNGYYARYENELRSEFITKSQTVMFQSIALTIFYLIKKIDITVTTLCQKKKARKWVTNAIHILIHFNFPGLLHVKLRKVLYQKMLSSNNDEAFRYLFTGSQFDSTEIKEKIGHLPNKMEIQSTSSLIKALKRFTKELKKMESDIQTVRDINQYLCDYEYEEVGFLQYDSSQLRLCDFKNDTDCSETSAIMEVVPLLQSLKENNCQFSNVTVNHFILIDFIISKCELILSGVNNSNMATLLKSCFDSITRSIRSIGETVDRTLVAIINILKSTRPHNNANRNVINAILAMKLYISNEDILNSTVPLTERKSVDVHLLVSKFDTFKRYNRFITTLIEHYAVSSCSTSSTREQFTKETMAKINKQCSSRNDKIELIKCVEIIIEDNLEKYKPLGAQIKRNDFTIDNLLMMDVVEKASNKYHSLSMLYKLKFSWEGEYKLLTEIVDFVKNQINPKFLGRYQLTMLKAFVFMSYENMKTIIQSSNRKNFLLYCDNMEQILKALNCTIYTSIYFPLRITLVYEMIVEYFEKFFQRYDSINKKALIRVIEIEQYYLGMQNQWSDKIDDKIVRLIPDDTLGRFSKYPGVEMAESSGLHKDGKKNISDLILFSDAVKEVWTNLTNVALILDLKRMSDLEV